MTRVCIVEACGRRPHARGFCHKHYLAMRRLGLLPRRPRAGFWSRVAKDSPGGCWLWTGATDQHGYGQMRMNGSTRRAHRIAYELLVGTVPAGMELDHLCRNPSCVNPEHLEPVTHRENIRRGLSPAAGHAAKTHCIRGHEFTPENTRENGRGRECRACGRERQRELRARSRVVR